ncbi:MAG: hypothetical protein OXI20_10445 [Rhodospirillales bacterium]|nr:hypothetical protein [Rhodospirillales bacterium]
MTAIEIHSPDAERLARRLKEASQARIFRRAINKAGSEARKDILPMLAEIYGFRAPRRAIDATARAAPPGAEIDRMAYMIRLRREVRIASLRADSRKFRRTAKRRARLRAGLLEITQPQASGERGVDRFRAVAGKEKGQFVLLPREGRRARRVRGPVIRRMLDTTPALRRRRDRVVDDLAANLMVELQKALKGAR